jgi:primary-amine oxidase
MAGEEKTVHELLSNLIILADRLIKSAQDAESSKTECSDLAKQATQLAQNLRSTVRLIDAPTLYEPPLRRVLADVSKTLNRAIALVKKCKHSGLLRQLFAITTTADFYKVSLLLENSIADVKWLLSVFDSDTGTNLTIPPIAMNDPILIWVWSYIAVLQMGQVKDKGDAANQLASLASDNKRKQQIIVEQGGVPPLLKLLKEGASPESQIAAATALSQLATNQERVRFIYNENAVQIIVRVLNDSPMKVRIPVVNLVSCMVEMDHVVQEDFGRENVTRPLVTLLSMD